MTRSQSRTSAARASARSTPRPASRKARTAPQAKAAHRGGEWGRGVAARLRALKGAAGVRAFAERVGLSPSLVSSYLNGGRLPTAEPLRRVAERTGVSLDWLLLGEGGETPLYRGLQVRSGTVDELESAAAAFLQLQVDAAMQTGELPLRPSSAVRQRWQVEEGEDYPEARFHYVVSQGAVLGGMAQAAIEATRRMAEASEPMMLWGATSAQLEQVADATTDPQHRRALEHVARFVRDHAKQAQDAGFNAWGPLAILPLLNQYGTGVKRLPGGGVAVRGARVTGVADAAEGA